MNLAHAAVQIAKALADADILFLADDEQQAEALAGAVRAIAPAHPVFFLPASDALPGDAAPPSPANAGHRVSALRAIRAGQLQDGRPHMACILSGEAAARRYPPPTAFDGAPPILAVGEAIETGAFADSLAALGYMADDRVDEPGEMAIRGEVVDIFPADAGLPIRIEIADGRIAALRSYDPSTQLTVADVASLEIGRATEPPLAQATAILAHLAPGRLAMADRAEERRRRFVKLAKDAMGTGRQSLDAIDDDAWTQASADWATLDIDPDVTPVARFAETKSPLAGLVRFATPLLADGHSILLAGSRRDIRFLRTRLGKRLKREVVSVGDWQAVAALEPGSAAAIEMPVDAGFVGDGLILVAAADLLGSRALVGEAPATSDGIWGSAGDIRIGDVVVHEDHGVGVVAGLEPAPAQEEVADGSGAGELIALTYADDARRLVAIDDADRIWRYGADVDAVTLDKLDGSSWRKRRGDIDAAIAESAKALTALAAERAERTAPMLDPDPAAYERFAGGFAYNETADQVRAIAAVRADLASGRPMDRLVVGDVGYGKTEVALRAAACAALSGYQVVIAAPTTVLARQHLEAFTQRFAASGVTVAGLSRLSTAAEKKAVKAGLADGSVAVVVGTGAVMAKGIAYAKLGLVVIDEEQRFGAGDKQRLRGSGDIHLLSLTATPIPRTLQMALVGLQQISVIATPPARRQPIRTSLDQYDDSRIRTALLREKGRGGQSFVVVPRIEDMAVLREKIMRLVPDLRLIEAHGKMPAAEIDEAMVIFAQGKGDILLATNIIEAGLDVPRANTMIVWRADRFGLAQLHQLRGRVGRGHRRGQVILLTEADHAIGERTLKRLRTLATYDRLGAGFEISAKDLDQRGGGDLLGETQAGHTRLIGIDLYQHLLGMALRHARGEDVERWTPELNLGATGLLPADWIPEPDIRLSLYVRLARIEDEAGLDALEAEMIDRFGPLPADAETLTAWARLRLAARTAGVQRIDAGPAAIAMTMRPDFAGDTAAAGLVEKKGRFLLAERTDAETRRERVQAVLDALVA
ncbi:TRCF domain-containing protein [uncultured Sphingomonas sp.]|uniref:TRCF domain-containing protein n=1 Tax=uncultured Sphingomonas sp. TaxID=158754 RepID=UPI002635ECE8|nr:TRCF domain-containing protein [uncultured Sphingomonas sp.]